MYSLKHMAVNLKYVSNALISKPHFFYRLTYNYMKAIANPKRPPVRFADIAVTYDCTMKCTHCSSTEMKRPDKSILTLQDYEIVAAKLIKSGLLLANFTGGEPLVRKDFFDIVRAFSPKKLLVAIQTNASIMNEDHLRELKKMGVDSISISIDGAEAEIHDRFRNSPGAFDKALDLLEKAKSLGFNVGISYCLSHENLHSDDRAKVEALSKKYDTLLNYNLAVPIGFWKGAFDALITREDRKHLNKLMEAYPKSKTDFETNYFVNGCGAIKEKLYINAYGEVMPCPFIQVSFGNIMEEEVEAIRDTAFQYKYFKEYEPMCLAAEDKDFILNTKCYSKDADDLQMPLHHSVAFFDRNKALGKDEDK